MPQSNRWWRRRKKNGDQTNRSWGCTCWLRRKWCRWANTQKWWRASATTKSTAAEDPLAIRQSSRGIKETRRSRCYLWERRSKVQLERRASATSPFLILRLNAASLGTCDSVKFAHWEAFFQACWCALFDKKRTRVRISRQHMRTGVLFICILSSLQLPISFLLMMTHHILQYIRSIGPENRAWQRL